MTTSRARIQTALKEQWARKIVRRVDIDLPMPPSVNALWKRGRLGKTASGKNRSGMVKTDHYATWSQSAGIYINRQKPGRIEGWFVAHILVEYKPDRTRDLDNCGKAILDCLQAHGIIENDRLAWEVHLGWTDAAEIHGARVIIEKCSRVADLVRADASGSVARWVAA